MSVNDLVTAILALGAVLVSIVALIISDAVDKRATRNTLTDLAVKINQKAAAYDKLLNETGSAKATADYARTKGSDDLYTRVKELEMLAGQADFLISRLGPGVVSRWIPSLAHRPRYPWSVTITIAQALESAQDPWWADRYWELGVKTRDQYVRAWTYIYWGMALCVRLEYSRAREKVTEGLNGFIAPGPDACIFRGDLYAAIIPFDPGYGKWTTNALREYGAVLDTDELYSTAQDRIGRVEALMANVDKSSSPSA